MLKNDHTVHQTLHFGKIKKYPAFHNMSRMLSSLPVVWCEVKNLLCHRCCFSLANLHPSRAVIPCPWVEICPSLIFTRRTRATISARRSVWQEVSLPKLGWKWKPVSVGDYRLSHPTNGISRENCKKLQVLTNLRVHTHTHAHRNSFLCL